MFQKTLTDRRRKYREQVNIENKLSSKIDTKEAIVLQYKDGVQRLLS